MFFYFLIVVHVLLALILLNSYSCSGHSEVPMLSEHYPGTEPPHAPVAFYPAYDKMPIYVPRGAHPPGPPPLLASKREGPEPHMLPAFYPTPYPPPVR